jgi:hypothetical protein
MSGFAGGGSFKNWQKYFTIITLLWTVITQL